MKKLLTALSVLSLLLVAMPAHAMVRPLFGIVHAGASASATRFCSFDGNVLLSTSVSGEEQVISADGTVSDLTVNLQAAPGAGTSYTFTLEKGTGGGANADTALACTVSDTSTSCSDHSDSISFAPGDTAVWKIVPTGTPAVVPISISSSFTGTTAGETIQPGGGASANMNTTSTNYFPPSGVNNITNIEASTTIYAPTSGSYDNLYFQVSVPLTTGSYTIALMLNDATTSLTCTVTNPSGRCNDTTHSVSFVQGDKLAISVDPSGAPNARVAGWGLRFKPTVDGESILSGIGGLLSAGNNTRYFSLLGIFGNGSSPNSTTTAPIAFTMKKSYYQGDVTLTGAMTRPISLEVNGIATALSAVVTAGNSAASDTTHSVDIAQGDQIEWKTTPTNSATANVNFFSMASVAFINPNTGSTGTSLYRLYTMTKLLLLKGKLLLQ